MSVSCLVLLLSCTSFLSYVACRLGYERGFKAYGVSPPSKNDVRRPVRDSKKF